MWWRRRTFGAAAVAAAATALLGAVCIAQTSGLREGRAYHGCREQIMMTEETVYEEELKCHNVTRVRNS